jgi:hypothetical protein
MNWGELGALPLEVSLLTGCSEVDLGWIALQWILAFRPHW